MKSTFYAGYAARSLLRGGQRTALAVFCIAVGVMAIVGLQLVTAMVRQALVSNARAVNQGDLSVQARSAPFQPADLAFFDELKSRGIITAYTPQSNSGGILQLPGGRRRSVSVRAVDPVTFPLVGNRHLNSPRGQTLRDVLSQPGAAVVTMPLASSLNAEAGAQVRIFLTSGRSIQLTSGGVATTDGAVWTGNTITVSSDTWQKVTNAPTTFQVVAITTPDPGRTGEASSAIRRQFPLANVRSTEDVLQQSQRGVETTRKFLVLIGLLALLIGGVGIVNTMQVLLSRRRVEIAVLKTVGYRRRDLYLVFGMEAALLGLAGGIAGGVLGIGIAWLLRALFIHAFPVLFAFSVDPGVVLGGVATGLATALIFGLLPIIRAASIRPQAVLRDLPDWQSASSRLQSLALILLLSVLFSVLASVILKSILWGAVAVYGVFLLLAAMSLVLSAILWLLSRLPVPDRYATRYVLLVSAGVAASLGVAAIPSLRGVGILILGFVLSGYLIVILPRTWKLNTKIALRNIGRTRARTTITLLALFIGVFAVGLILVLGQDVKANLGNVLTSQLDYNLIAVVAGPSAGEVESQLRDLPGLLRQRSSNFAAANPIEIDGQTPAARVVQGQTGPTQESRRQLALLAGVQGYNLAAGDLPTVAEITAGRNLAASDAGSANVVVDDGLRKPPLRLEVGSTVTLKPPNGVDAQRLTIVGFYRQSSNSTGFSFNIAPVFGPQSLAADLAGAMPFRIFYLQVSPGKTSQAQTRLESNAPDAIVLDLEDFLTQFEQILNNILLMLTAIASLALLAGVIIVANAVALAMLERRRELGILKAVGYTSSRVLTGVVIENVLGSGLGGLMGMAPVALAVAFFNRLAGVSFGVGTPIAIAVVLGVVLLSTATTVLVAWGAVRVRPLTTLRYE